MDELQITLMILESEGEIFREVLEIKQLGESNIQRLGDFFESINFNSRWVLAFKFLNVLVINTGKSRKFFLRQFLFRPEFT